MLGFRAKIAIPKIDNWFAVYCPFMCRVQSPAFMYSIMSELIVRSIDCRCQLLDK